MNRWQWRAHWPTLNGFQQAVLLSWLGRAFLGWVVAMPLAMAVGSSKIGLLPEGDRALFEPGGLWLLEVLFRRGEALSAGLRASLVLLLLALVLKVLESIVVCFVAADSEESAAAVLLYRALPAFPRFLAIAAAEFGAMAGLVLLSAVAVRGSAELGRGLKNEALQTLPPSVMLLFALSVLAATAVIGDLCRAQSTLTQTAGVLPTVRTAVRLARDGWLACASGYLLASGLGALSMVLGARLTESLDVGRSGGFRVLAVFAVHQGVLLLLCYLQALWVRRTIQLAAARRSVPEMG